jgi:hypothetical protein
MLSVVEMFVECVLRLILVFRVIYSLEYLR